MVNAQNWLGINYSDKKGVEKIELNMKDFWHPKKETDIQLEGELLVNDYPNLKSLQITKTKLTNVKITNCPQLNHLFLSRNEITNLEVRGKFNQLTGIACENNPLANIIFPDEAKKLQTVFLADNNFNQDLSLFSKLTNLEELRIYDNNFYGSLEPLKNLKRLEFLQILHTDIDSGLEYLSDSVKRFICDCSCSYYRSSCEKPEAGCKILEAQLASYDGHYPSWREANQELIKKARISGLSKEQQLTELNIILAKQILETQDKLQSKDKELTDLKNQLENRQIVSQKVIEQLKQENKQLEERIKSLSELETNIQIPPK